MEKPDDTFIPTKALQPVPELKIDISSLETIDAEWAKGIPLRLLQKNYVVHEKSVTLYRGIDVRPGMKHVFLFILSCSTQMQLPAIKILGAFQSTSITQLNFFGSLKHLEQISLQNFTKPQIW